MNDEQIEDLKQYIDGRIPQSESLTQEENNKLRKEMRGDFSGVAKSIERINQMLEEQERRVTKIEEKAA